MGSPDAEPTIITKRALDVTPYEHGIWCSIGGAGPRVVKVVGRRWSDDGEAIWFLLESHNTMRAAPDEEMRVVEHTLPPAVSEKLFARWLADDADRMAKRPRVNVCPTCGHRMMETNQVER